MSDKAIFMNQLEYLLQDMSEEEKREAIQYYYDYFEDAGEENEELIIKELGSPERIAAIIRADLNSSLEGGGEFTETGYVDPRFQEPPRPLAERTQLEESTFTQEEKKPGSNDQRVLKAILLIILAIVVVPLMFRILGGITNGALRLAAALLGLFIVPGMMALSAFIGGIIAIMVGIGSMVAMAVSPASGILAIGLGLLFIGGGFFLLILCFWVYGTLIPKLFRGIMEFLHVIINRKKGGSQS